MKKLSLLLIVVVLFSAISIVYADINEELVKAAKEGNIETVRVLLDKGANINAKDNNGATALIAASAMGQTDTVKLLINKGADVNAKGNYGYAALMGASLKGYTEVAKLLIDKGADVNAKDNKGATALMDARFFRGIYRSSKTTY